MSSSLSQQLPKPAGDKRTLTRRFDIQVTCKKTKSYADNDPNRPWYRFQLALIPKHLAHLVDRVQLKLDPSYEVDTRTVRDPFVFSEKAWGQYPIQITVFPKDEFNHPPIHVPHLDLVLTKSRYTETRALAFRNLPDSIKQKYFSSATTSGGPPSTESSSQGQPPSNHSSSSDLSTAASTPIEATSPRQLSPPPVPAGSTTGQPKNGRKLIAPSGGGRERKVSSTSAAAAASFRPPVSSSSSRAPVSQSTARTSNTRGPAASNARPPAPPKRKAADPPLPFPASPSASDPSRPNKRMKPTLSSSQPSASGNVAAMLGLAAHPPASSKRPAAASARKPPAAAAPAAPAPSVASILPAHKIPDDRIPRITNPHSAAHALVRSPPPTYLPARPVAPMSPLPLAMPAPADPTTTRVAGGGITVRRVEMQPTSAPAGAPVYSGGAKLLVRSPPPRAPAPGAPASVGSVSVSGSAHATPSRAASNAALHLPAKPSIAPPPPPSLSVSATGTPLLGNLKTHPAPAPAALHATPPRASSATIGGLAMAMASPPRPDPDNRERLKNVLARIPPAASVELAKHLYARNYAARAPGAEAEGKALYDKVANALVLDVWRVPAEVVREVWEFVREKGLVVG